MKISFPGGNTNSSALASGDVLGAGSQVYISGIPVGDNLGIGGGGSPVDSRAVTGNMIPDTNKVYGMGQSGAVYSSGFFDILHLGDASVSGIVLNHAGVGNTLQVQRGDGSIWSRVQALDFKLSTSECRLGNDGLFIYQDATVSFSNGAFESDDKDVVLARATSGVLLLGDGASTSGAAIKGSGADFSGQVTISGVAVGDFLGVSAAADLSAVAEPILPATSGAYDIGSSTKVWSSGFFDGIVLAAPTDGSLWKLTVDENGILSTTSV